jgi:hypothetical protein
MDQRLTRRGRHEPGYEPAHQPLRLKRATLPNRVIAKREIARMRAILELPPTWTL